MLQNSMCDNFEFLTPLNIVNCLNLLRFELPIALLCRIAMDVLVEGDDDSCQSAFHCVSQRGWFE